MSSLRICPKCHCKLEKNHSHPPSATRPSATGVVLQTAAPFKPNLQTTPSGAWTGLAPKTAEFWRRAVALGIDLLILAPLCALAMIILPFIGSFLTALSYFVIFETSKWQATPGKRLLGLKVVDANGVALRPRRSLLRYLCRYLSALPLGGGYLLALFTPNHQALHDLLASTKVLRD